MSVWKLPGINFADGYQFDVVAKGVRMRAAAHLLKSAPVVVSCSEEAGWQISEPVPAVRPIRICTAPTGYQQSDSDDDSKAVW